MASSGLSIYWLQYFALGNQTGGVFARHGREFGKRYDRLHLLFDIYLLAVPEDSISQDAKSVEGPDHLQCII